MALNNQKILYILLVFFRINSSVIDTDLAFIYHQIKNNHPGYCDEKNPNFSVMLEEGYNLLKEVFLQRNICDDDKKQLIISFLKSFNCIHLRAKYDNQNEFMQEKEDVLKKKWCFKAINEKSFLIEIPSFDINIVNKAEKEHVLKKIKECAIQEKALFIFDLRSNGGGQSMLGHEILEALFGQKIVAIAKKKLNSGVYVEWRASEDNVAYIENFFKNKLSVLDKNAKRNIGGIILGMQSAIDNNELFYKTSANYIDSVDEEFIEEAELDEKSKKRIILLIDKKCASATLTFIDELMQIEPETILMGEETSADSLYLDVCSIELPSKQGRLVYPMKVFRGRLRGNNESYKPHILF